MTVATEPSSDNTEESSSSREINQIPSTPSDEINQNTSEPSDEINQIPSTPNGEQSTSDQIPIPSNQNYSQAVQNFAKKIRDMTNELQTKLLQWEPANISVITKKGATWYAQGRLGHTRSFGVNEAKIYLKIRHIFHLLNTQKIPLNEAVHAFALAHRLVNKLVPHYIPQRREHGSYTRVLRIRAKYNNQTNEQRFSKKQRDGNWLADVRSLCEKVFRVAVIGHNNTRYGDHFVLGGLDELLYEATIAMEGIINYIVNCTDLRYTYDREQFVKRMAECYAKTAEEVVPVDSQTATKMRTEMVIHLSKMGISHERPRS